MLTPSIRPAEFSKTVYFVWAPHFTTRWENEIWKQSHTPLYQRLRIAWLEGLPHSRVFSSPCSPKIVVVFFKSFQNNTVNAYGCEKLSLYTGLSGVWWSSPRPKVLSFKYLKIIFFVQTRFRVSWKHNYSIVHAKTLKMAKYVKIYLIAPPSPAQPYQSGFNSSM